MKRTVERWGVRWIDSSPRCCCQRRGTLLDPGSRKQDTRNSWDCHSMCKANETTALDSVVSSQSFLADNSWDKTSSCCGLSQVVCHSGKSGSSVFISFHWSQKLFFSPFSSLNHPFLHWCSSSCPGLKLGPAEPQRECSLPAKTYTLIAAIHVRKSPRQQVLCLRSASASQPMSQEAACTNEWRLRGKKQEKKKTNWPMTLSPPLLYNKQCIECVFCILTARTLMTPSLCLEWRRRQWEGEWMRGCL